MTREKLEVLAEQARELADELLKAKHPRAQILRQHLLHFAESFETRKNAA